MGVRPVNQRGLVTGRISSVFQAGGWNADGETKLGTAFGGITQHLCSGDAQNDVNRAFQAGACGNTP